MQDIAPTNISINGHPCSIQLNITLSNVVPDDGTSGGRPLSAEGGKGNATVEGVEQADVATVSPLHCGLPTKPTCAACGLPTALTPTSRVTLL